MNKWNCNAFTGQCKECCATTRINEAQVTYCIGHSLNNEDRVVSACEGDLNALKALTVMACISRKAPYQSNTSPLVLDEEGKIMASRCSLRVKKRRNTRISVIVIGMRLPIGR